MKISDLIIKSYGALHNYNGIPYWMLTPFRKIVRNVANRILPHYLMRSRKNIKDKGASDVIVSFTSYPARINDIWLVVECMLRQSYQPSKIILWLSKEQFPDVDNIPVSLRKREGDMFEIRMVDGDIRSHKKYYYVAKEYPDSLIFLIDDDLFYSTDLLERTMKAHKEHPASIICNYGYHISYNNEGKLLPYSKWPREYHYSENDDLFFGSGGGTLFQPSWLYKDLTNIDLAMRLAPIADDIWLNTMAMIVKRDKVMLRNGLILPIPIKGKVKLASTNIGEAANDRQLVNVKEYYEGMGLNPFKKRV